MSHKVPLVRVLTSATGNSTPITLGVAYSSLFMLPSEAGAMDGRVYTYLIVDGNNWELGRGVYTASGTTLARTTIIAARNGGTLGTSRITLSGTAQVRFVETAQDMDGVRGTRNFTGTTDTINDSDQGYVVTYSNASAIAVSLAQASVANLFMDGWKTFVQNLGAGLVTITPATSTIQGAATLPLASGMGAMIWSDGTNYRAFYFPVTKPLLAANNLSDVASASTALGNLSGLSYGSSQSLSSTAQAQARANAGVTGRNRIINGQFTLNERAAGGGLTDNTYGADRWRVIGEFSAANLFANNYNAAGGNVPAGTLQFSGTTDKGGFFQPIEGINCKDLRGKTVTLSMLMLVSNARLGNMKIGILEWTGAEDATSASPVATWGGDGVTPTLATNWAFKNTPANLSVTTSSAAYSTTVTLGTTFTNLAVMIWNDDKSYNVSDNFSVANVQLEEGGVATPYEFVPIGLLKRLCLRYLPWAGGASGDVIGTGDVFGTSIARIGIRWIEPPRVPPTAVTVQNLANFTLVSGSGVNNAATGISLSGQGPTGGQLNCTTSVSLTNAAASYLSTSNANARLLFSGCEL